MTLLQLDLFPGTAHCRVPFTDAVHIRINDVWYWFNRYDPWLVLDDQYVDARPLQGLWYTGGIATLVVDSRCATGAIVNGHEYTMVDGVLVLKLVPL